MLARRRLLSTARRLKGLELREFVWSLSIRRELLLGVHRRLRLACCATPDAGDGVSEHAAGLPCYVSSSASRLCVGAQPAIIPISDTEKKNILLWVHERLAEGDIEGVTDPRIRADYDLNSAWKVADLALHCTRRAGRDRPTMPEVAEGIRESLQLETSWRSMRGSSTGTLGDAESELSKETLQFLMVA
uniref:Uncharacterized protein n=1 Tax=Oryza rufipogon TaxID=4529 RepID=A0A0E0QL97_ORYRU